jgi:hypothetical protein
MRPVNYAENLLQDFRYSFRMLAKAPGFTAAAVVTLARGIGANAAIFSLVDAVMLRNLPVREPGKLVLFSDNPNEGMSVSEGLSGDGRWREFSYPLYQDLARRNRLLQGICAFQSGEDALAVRLEGQQGATQVAVGKLVSGNYFSVLGVNALAGRMLTPADDTPGAPPATVVSFNYWKNKLGGDPALVGRAIDIDGMPATLVGIAPPGFFGERVEKDSADFWLPLSLRPGFPATALPYAARDLADPHTAWLDLIGRLKPGVGIAQANTEIDGELRQALSALLGPKLGEAERQQLQHQYVKLAPGGRGSPRCATSTRRRSKSCWPSWAWSCSSRAPTPPTSCSRGRRRGGRRWQCGLRSARPAAASCGRCSPSPCCSRPWAARSAHCWPGGERACWSRWSRQGFRWTPGRAWRSSRSAWPSCS